LVRIESALVRRWTATYVGGNFPVGKHIYAGSSKSLDEILHPSSVLLDHNLSRDASPNARQRRRRRQWGDQAPVDEVVDPPEPGLKKD
jgi:hypothetical protein